MAFDPTGRVINPTFRNYRIPAFADVPRNELFFAKTKDTTGPLGAKSMSESPVNPVAPALANALADATGIRFHSLPLSPERIFAAIHEKHGSRLGGTRELQPASASLRATAAAVH
jgi:CO/xanthine dehydrogenase Mo-binding subunit